MSQTKVVLETQTLMDDAAYSILLAILITNK